MAWKERKDMITILKNKYDPTVKNALAYIIKNNVKEYDYKIFTGEAKPNVIRLLPSLSISTAEIDLFLKALTKASAQISNKAN
jgi:acetylornithine/succinyldiaminopimelate/putrescine aminotransferase